LLALAAAFAAGSPSACYPAAGQGVDPPALSFYFPVGLTVSRGGNVMYAINSDFDLQWNGGTIQSLDLHLIRRHTAMTIIDPTNPNLPLAQPPDPDASCPAGPPVITTLNDAGVEPGWACAPPTIASYYMRDSVAIGAFATDIQLSSVDRPCLSLSADGGPAVCTPTARLLAPVRGDASVTWADVIDDSATVAPLQSDTAATYAPFHLDCGLRDAQTHCDPMHHAGNDANQPGDTRLITMPGEPFGMAQSDDGSALVITHQTATDSTLFTTFTAGALLTSPDPAGILMPVIQYVAGNVPNGGIGIASVPHSTDAYPECFPDPTAAACQAVFPRPAFLQTSRTSAQVALVRYYNDSGDSGPSAPFRPFIQNEANYTLNVNAGTTDFARGIAIDPSPRIRCKAAITVPPTDPTYPALAQQCAQIPARVFIASRGPPSLIIGEIGEPITAGGSYDADLAIFTDTLVLPPGPSAVHLAPVIDNSGNMAMRVFVVCFDSNQIIDYDPDQGLIEEIIPVGLGPFALTFDPFDFDSAALGMPVGIDPRDADLGLKTYRFGYVASFTQSYMQVLDLDNSTANAARTIGSNTFGTVVYTVGVPTSPKGT
jgi:hypothetical protein